MAKAHELSINVVNLNRQKALTGLGQTALQRVRELGYLPSWARNAAGEEREPKPDLSNVRNVVSP